MFSDVEISRSQKPKDISKLAEELQILPEEVFVLVILFRISRFVFCGNCSVSKRIIIL